MKVLHLLQNSFPRISGSTIRTSYIFKYQKRFAKIIAFTSFLYNSPGNNNVDMIDGIPFFRVNRKIGSKLRLMLKYIDKFCFFLFNHFKIKIESRYLEFLISFYMKKSINNIAKFYNVDIIHAHSHYLVGHYGLKVSKKRNLPFIYEVRGFLEENLIANTWKSDLNPKLISYRYNKIKKRDTELMKKSDLIITLSKSMKEEIKNRNIEEKLIKIIPNGIDIDLLKTIKPNLNLKQKLNLKNQKVIGYIGRMTWYEGIEILLKSIPILLREIDNIKVLLIGNISKSYLKYLKNIAKELDLSKYILFLDAIPHEEIRDYYSIIDIIIIPRLDFKVCRIVTPLKPIESMALKTLVIASDFPSFRSMIKPDQTGVLFKYEDPEDLASKITYYLKHPEEKKKIEANARNYVEKKLNWKLIIPKYKELYDELLNSIKLS